jgi:hypothetical protein
MTGRDRLVLICLSVFAVLGAVWIIAVSPERKEATKLDAQVSAANGQLQSAESQLASARSAQTRYASAYASIVSLGKAVPASQEVPSLIYELAQASNRKSVDFSSIVSGTSAAGAGAQFGNTAASGVAASSAAFSQMPFTFVFNGSFLDLYHLFQQLDRFTTRGASGSLHVSGRLLTIQGAKLAPATDTSAEQASGKHSTRLSGTITASAYVLPASQGVTGGATPSSPAAAATQTASNNTSSGSSPSAPAIARVTP